MTSRVLFCLLVMVLACSLPAAAEIYKWVDKDGKIRFTDTPPPAGIKGEQVTPQPNVVSGGPKPAGKVSSRTTGTSTSTTSRVAQFQPATAPDPRPPEPSSLRPFFLPV